MRVLLSVRQLRVAAPVVFLGVGLLPAVYAQNSGRVLREAHHLEPDTIRLSRFGEHVLLDGKTALVNVFTDDLLAGNSGAIYEHDRGPSGLVQTGAFGAEAIQSLLLASDLDQRDGILVASSMGWPGPSTNIGRGYVWDIVGDDYVLSGFLDARDASPVSAFGGSIAVVDRDTVVVGRFGDIIGGIGGGSLHVFRRTPNGWIGSQKVFPPVGTVSFTSNGFSLDYDNGYLVSGEQGNRAHVYRREPDGRFVYHQLLLDPRAYSRDAFGFDVAIEGDLMAVGDPGDFGAGLPGAVSVYRLDQGSWDLEETLLASDGYVTNFGTGVVNDDFGWRVAIDEGRIAVGAQQSGRGAPPAGVNDLLGSAYVFARIGGAWVETFQLHSSEAAPSSGYGTAIDIDGDAVMVGARWFPFKGVNNIGGAFLFELPFGELVCDGVVNSTGTAATLDVTGDRRVSIGRLLLTASDLPPGALTLFLAAPAAGFTQNPGGSQGNLCVSGPVSRFVTLAGAADVTGAYSAQLDVDAIPTPNAGEIPLLPGDSLTFQAWYRDANPGPTSNFTSARLVEFR